MNSYTKKSLLLLSLLLLGSCHAQPIKEQQQQQQVREQRQLKGSAAAAAEADVKMLASGAGNMTPASMPMGGLSMGGLAMNQMGLARYPSFPGMMFGAGAAPLLGINGMPGAAGLSGFSGGLQANIANAFPVDPSMSLGLGLGLPNAGFGQGIGIGQGQGQGLGLGGYPGAGFMYGNPLYPSQQLGAGFGPQPPLDNFAALNNIIGMANAQGLGPAPGALYGQPLTGAYFGGDAGGAGLLERMSMRSYAPGF